MQLYREAFVEAQAAWRRATLAPQSASPSSSAAHRDWSVALGSGRVQFGQYPAKWQTDPTLPPSCTTDYVIFALNVSGVTGGQPSIVGLNQLYSESNNSLCNAFQPNFLFSYNTNTTSAAAQGRILTSPVLSLDGKKVAFIETSTVAGQRTSVLHVLKIPTTGMQVTATPASLPPAGAMLNATIGGASNTRSSPWIDYVSDVAYVGLDNGRLYKITGVFRGTPTVAGPPWPVVVSPGLQLSSPVLDSDTGNLFIGSQSGALFAVNVNTLGTPVSISVGRSGGNNPGIIDSPMFDATGATVFAVTSNDASLAGASVVQVNATNFNVVTRVGIGQGSSVGGANVNLYDGDFDDAYFNNPATGHMLVCGTGAADTTPHRYLLGFNGAGVLQPGSSVQLSTNIAARCGPITEFFNPNVSNGPTDFFFWGLTRNCPGFGANGCIMSLANGSPQASVQESGGTSGIVIDNTYVTSTGGSSIYFSTEANPLNAVKLTQQGLQ